MEQRLSKEKECDLLLNRKFYNIVMVKKAMKDFKKMADITVFEKNDILEFKIKSKDKKLSNDKLSLEFRNYILGLMKNKGVV